MNGTPLNPHTKKRVVAPYCRVSTDKSDQLNSLESQKTFFAGLIQRNPDWILGEIYFDEGISGTSVKKRKNFNRLIKDALAGKVQFIITKEVSRFARNTVDTLVYTRELKKHGVGVYFALDNINTLDPDGELRLTIMASIAQEESRKTSERVKWGQKRQMEKGVVFGHGLLGYSVKDGTLTVNPEEARAVKLIFDKFLEGCGSRAIISELQHSGFPSGLTEGLNRSTIYRILRNEKYAGDLCQHKSCTPDFLTHERKRNPEDKSLVYIKDHHEPIVDRGIWDRVQQELKKRSPDDAIKTKHSNRYWCSGKLQCGICGKTFTRNAKKHKNGILKRWRCYGYSGTAKHKNAEPPGHKAGCNNAAVNEAVLTAAVRHALIYCNFDKSRLIREILPELKQTAEKPELKDTTPLYKKIENFKLLKRNLIDLAAKGLLGGEDFKEQNLYYDSEICAARNQIEESDRSNIFHKPHSTEKQNLTEVIHSIAEFRDNSLALYKAVLNKIVLLNRKVLVVYLNHLPFGLKMKYRTFGRMENYTVIIETAEPVYGNELT